MKLRSDMNARTAMVYGGAAFLLIIVGFRSVIATLDGGGESHASGGYLDGKEISELTGAVIKVAQMGEGLSNLASGKVRDEIKKEVNEILTNAIKK